MLNKQTDKLTTRDLRKILEQDQHETEIFSIKTIKSVHSLKKFCEQTLNIYRERDAGKLYNLFFLQSGLNNTKFVF